MTTTAPARRIGGAMAAAASFFAFAATTGVSAESLAQPRDAALERAASDYVRFREDVAAIEAIPFTSAETTREAHRRLSAHNSEAMSSGWVAYAALVAADTPAFRKALEEAVAAKKKGKNGLAGADAFFAQLAADPAYPRTLAGANDAVARVLAMTTQDAARFTTLGEAFKSQAYAMQKTKWGVAKIPASAARLTDADAFARSRSTATTPAPAATTDKGVTSPSLASADAPWRAEWGPSAGAGRMSEGNAEVIMNRVLNLAARYAVSGVSEKTVGIYAKNDKSDQCLSFAALTLRQCIAATRAPYEEAFCLGEHGLNDVSGCIGWVASVGK
ncbi:MAG: hypothetical protein ACKVS5_13345 [Parvularculaceae bacterium]